MSKVVADSVKFNQVAWRLADALGLVPEGATQIEADIDELMALAEAAIRPRILTTLEEVKALPRGAVLLCREREVFWLPLEPMAAPGFQPDDPEERVWFAAGYDPRTWTWSDARVLEWAPLTLLHIGDGG